MATPRKPFVRLETSLLREPWPRDVKATLAMLLCFLGDRWARDRLTSEQACHATLSRAQLHEITGRAQLVHARRALRALGARVSLSIRERGEFTEISFVKFAKTQELPSRGREQRTRPIPISAPAPSPAPSPAEEQESQPLCDATRDPSDPPASEPQEDPKPGQKPQPQAIDATLRLAAIIPQCTPGASVPKIGFERFDRWALEIDRLERLDNDGNWTWEEINAVITWLPTHDDGEFAWGLVIRSARKFRKHFPRLMADMKRVGHKPETEDQRNLKEVLAWQKEAQSTQGG